MLVLVLLIFLWQSAQPMEDTDGFLIRVGDEFEAIMRNLDYSIRKSTAQNLCESIPHLEDAQGVAMSIDGGISWKEISSASEVCISPQEVISSLGGHTTVLKIINSDEEDEWWYVWGGGAQRIALEDSAIRFDQKAQLYPKNEQLWQSEWLIGFIGVLLCILIIVTGAYQSKQARILKELYYLEEQRYFLDQKRWRKEATIQGLQISPFEWLSLRIHDAFSYRPILLQNTLVISGAAQFLSVFSDAGDHFMVSVYSPKELKQRLRARLGNKKQSGLFKVTREWQIRVDLRNAKVVRLSLGTAGEFFDIEAHQVAEALAARKIIDFDEDVHGEKRENLGFWDQPLALYFYWRRA